MRIFVLNHINSVNPINPIIFAAGGHMKKLLLLVAFLFAFQNVNAMGIPEEYGARLAMNMGKLGCR